MDWLKHKADLSTSIDCNQGMEFDWIANCMELANLDRGLPTYRFNQFSGTLKGTFEALCKELTEAGLPLVVQTWWDDDENRDIPSGVWTFADSCTAGCIQWNNDGRSYNFRITSNNMERLEEIKTVFRKYWKAKDKTGSVYALITTANGALGTRAVGVAGIKFEPANYRDDVVSNFNHVIEDLDNPVPCGRIVLLDGPPGTGKTYLIRSLIDSVPDATFLMIPSGMVSQLGSPQILTTLLSVQNHGSPETSSSKKSPLILVIEDADNCLMSRDAASMDSLSTLLNMSDGIIGNIIDIRIVATTNAKIKQIDPAIGRDGRLCRRIEVGLLDREQALAVYKRLTGKEIEFKNPYYPLASVYKAAKTDGWKDEEPAHVGFLNTNIKADPGFRGVVNQRRVGF